MFEEYEFEGKTYKRQESGWYKGFVKVQTQLAQKINSTIFEECKDMQLSISDLDSLGDTFAATGSYQYATIFLLKATQLDFNIRRLSKVTSIMRRINKAQDVVDVYEQYLVKFDAYELGPQILTSIAAAYCDINKPEIAKNVAGRAYKASKGCPDQELRNVYHRIDSMLY